MATQTMTFRLPLPGWPRAQVESNFALTEGRLLIEDQERLRFDSRQALESGCQCAHAGAQLTLGLDPDRASVQLAVNGQPAPLEIELRAPTSRSAWIHAWLALGASFFGFVASYLYLRRAELLADAWSLKMAIHMAGWHLLLTLTLFPASVWGQRAGIRAVQGVSLVFFLIHLGISLANMGGEASPIDGPWIALFNALSGIGFFAAVIYGQWAHRDMDPLASLER